MKKREEKKSFLFNKCWSRNPPPPWRASSSFSFAADLTPTSAESPSLSSFLFSTSIFVFSSYLTLPCYLNEMIRTTFFPIHSHTTRIFRCSSWMDLPLLVETNIPAKHNKHWMMQQEVQKNSLQQLQHQLILWVGGVCCQSVCVCDDSAICFAGGWLCVCVCHYMNPARAPAGIFLFSPFSSSCIHRVFLFSLFYLSSSSFPSSQCVF